MRLLPRRGTLCAASYLFLAATAAQAQVLSAPTPDARPFSRVGHDTATLPLKPERFARFTTTKGTWMSVDVSPDGKRLLMVEEVTSDEHRGTSVTVAHNWFAAFRK